jgi:hypothetical protein
VPEKNRSDAICKQAIFFLLLFIGSRIFDVTLVSDFILFPDSAYFSVGYFINEMPIYHLRYFFKVNIPELKFTPENSVCSL